MQTFPTKGNGITLGESPSLFKHTFAENVRKASTEGGYEFRRRRFSRTPPRTIETGFIGLKHSDFIVLENFYTNHQMDKEFIYYDYHFGVNRTVRFDEFKPDAATIGQTKLWNLKIKMSEV